MTGLKKVVQSPYFLWTLLALPSVPMILSLLQGTSGGESVSQSIMGTAGVLSAMLLIATLAISPLTVMFPKSRMVSWMLRRRRYFGVAAFSYALVHVLFYFVGMETLARAAEGLLTPAVLMGWAAFFIFLPMAITSNKVMTRAMGWRSWKTLQRLGYVSAVLVLAHWVMVEREFGPAVFFVILGLLEAFRLWHVLTHRKSREEPAGAVAA